MGRRPPPGILKQNSSVTAWSGLADRGGPETWSAPPIGSPGNALRLTAQVAPVLQPRIGRPGPGIRPLAERTIRNYDPRMPRATHLVDLGFEDD